MACFVAPATVAIATTVTRKVVQKREGISATEHTETSTPKVCGKWTQRLGWLNTMLWGGSALLLLEHIWHGEVIASPPFLTSLQSAEQIGPMLREIAVYGGTMTAAIFAVWTVMVLIAEFKPRWMRSRQLKTKAASRDA